MTLTPVSAVHMPILALRGLTVYPNMVLHFDVGRDASIKALNQAMTEIQTIFLVTQRDLSVEAPKQDDLYEVGTIASVRQILRLPDDNVRVMVEGITRGRLQEITETDPYLVGKIEELPCPSINAKRSSRTEAVIRQTYELFETYTELSPKMTPEVLSLIHI